MPRRTFFFLISFSALLALGFTGGRARRHHHSVNASWGHRQPATDCSDLRIRFDDQDAVARSEERTLTKADAPGLQVHPHTNGGGQGVGRGKEDSSATAGKERGGAGAPRDDNPAPITMRVEK